MKPTARVLKCLCRLQEPGFEPLLEYLGALREEARDMMETTQNGAVHIHQFQGRARAMSELLTTITTARDVLTKIETTGR